MVMGEKLQEWECGSDRKLSCKSVFCSVITVGAVEACAFYSVHVHSLKDMLISFTGHSICQTQSCRCFAFYGATNFSCSTFEFHVKLT